MSDPDWELVVDQSFLEDLSYWVAAERKTALKIMDLMEAIRREPYSGIGKPEPLRHLGNGVWSRRITQEHRLVYKISGNRILFAQARYHY